MLRRFLSLNRDQRFMYVSGLLWGFGMSLFLYLQPLYIERLGANPAQIGLVLGISGLTVTFLYIPIGLWADRRGRKPVILAGWSLGAVSTLVMAFVPDWRWLIPAMVAYQLSNFAMPAYYGYIVAGEKGGSVARTFAIIASASSIGSIISPAVGGWIGEQFGLRAVYLSAGIAFTLSALVLWPLSAQSSAPSSSAHADPRQLASNWRFLWQILFILLLFFVLDLGQVMAPKFLEDVRGLTVGQIGWLGTVGSLGIVVFSIALGQLSVERPWSLVLGQLAALVAGILLLSTPVPAFILIAYFIHGSNRLVRPLVIGRLARSLDPATLSFGYGFYETAMRLGLALSPYAAGLLYTHSPTWPLYAGVIGLSLTLLLTFTLPTSLKPRPAAVSKLARSMSD
jgi:DHA1 family multidrug resistance protein-like MFS transporter